MEDADNIHRAKEIVAAQAEMYRERLLTTELSLWNMLAALDGLLIAAASILAAFGRGVPAWCLLGVVALSILSLILLCLNFYGRRNLYRTLGDEPPAGVWQGGPAYREYVGFLQNRKQQHEMTQQRIELRENACAYLAAAALVLLIIGMCFVIFHNTKN